jgi:RNA polymerase sigma-70 factor (ECF subfamily)
LGLELALPPPWGDREPTSDARLRAMVDTYFETVWRSLRRLGVPEAGADDGVQQVFLIASRRLDEIEVGGERRYLLGIALRVASETRRAIHRRREVPLDAVVADLSLRGARPHRPDEMLEHKRLLALLAAWLDEMPDKVRDAFVLFELEELSASEVAQVLGVPVGTVASRVRRARERIRENLARRGTP